MHNFSHLAQVNLKMFSNRGGFKHNFSYLAQVNFEIFSNHGGFKHKFSHLSQVNYKMFSNHGGPKHNFSHLAQVNYNMFSNHGGSKHNFSHLAQANFKIVSNHGGFKHTFWHLAQGNFKSFSIRASKMAPILFWEASSAPKIPNCKFRPTARPHLVTRVTDRLRKNIIMKFASTNIRLRREKKFRGLMVVNYTCLLLLVQRILVIPSIYVNCDFSFSPS